MANYPLLFGYTDLVAGNGFLAGVVMKGRALIVEDEEGAWMYGVTPGGVCADGDSQKEAAAEFRNVYRAVLFDIAAEAGDFEEFCAGVEAFYNDQDEALKETWEAAVEAVRANEVDSNWLQKRAADSPCQLRVAKISETATEDDDQACDQHVKRPQPSFNSLDSALLAA